MTDETVQDEPAETQKAPEEFPAQAAGLSLAEVPFGPHAVIMTGARLPQYDRGPVKAYAARGDDRLPQNMIAYICEDHLSPRSMKASSYAQIMNPGLIHLEQAGVVDWPPAGKQKYCFLYENRLGNRLMQDDTRGGLGMRPERVVSAVVRPLVSALLELRDRHIFHGGIRLSNIYDGGAGDFERVILGECFSLPPGYTQPVLYETIDRAMCSPIGRGEGTEQDDLYALGVCLALLLRHGDPSERLSDGEIIERKMEDGSYILLLGKDRLSGAILELMRGLLQDDARQRWTLDEVVQWLDGRRLSPKQPAKKSKASRPLIFRGEKYIRPELLAQDLNQDIAEARLLIENGEVEQWISRALSDKMLMARYENAIKIANEGDKGSHYAEQLVTRVGMALDPAAPLRYRNITVMPDGVGAALTEAYILRRDLQTYTDFFMAYFITQWLDLQNDMIPDVSGLISRYDGARAYLRNRSLGFGLERCLYALNPEIHCLSEKLKKFYIRNPEDMLRAFEALSSMPDRPAMFFDRHSIAFLSVKDRKNIDPFLHDLNLPDLHRRVMAEVKILASIQKRSGLERFPGIASWIVDNLEPVYERFHDRELRRELKKKAERLQETGDLAKILSLFDDVNLYQDDNTKFRKAMRRYYDLEKETSELEQSLRDEKTHGRATARQVAAIVSAMLAGVIILVTVFTAG
ncbi:MAG: hypothetical protein WC989_09860 [Micavibrio sp.]